MKGKVHKSPVKLDATVTQAKEKKKKRRVKALNSMLGKVKVPSLGKLKKLP